MLTATESKNRISKFQEMLVHKGIDGALFIFPIDVYYFTGTRQNSTLWVPAIGEATLMVRKSLARAKQESPIADLRPFPSSKEFAAVIPEGATKIGFTFDVAPAQQLAFYQKLLPGREFVDISPLNREIRSVKSAFELEQLRNSAKNLCSVFAQVPEFLKAGMRELDLAAEFEYRLRKTGHEGYVRMRAFNQELFGGLTLSPGAASYGFFDGAVTGRGLSSASPQGASLDIISLNVPVFVDFTGVFNGYITDMTRIFVIGDLDPQLQEAFDLSIKIQAEMQKGLIPGAICEELFFESAEMAAVGGLGEYYMGMPGENAKFVGHGVGLELDEFPVLAQGFKTPLVEGNVIAIEPKFVFPGKGVIGIENTFAVTKSGGEKITAMPDEIVYL